MFSLSRKTDYALLVLTALAQHEGDFLSVKTLSKTHRLPYRFLSHVLAPLLEAGIVESKEGVHGGYRLAKKPSDVSLRDIVAAEEEGIALTMCVDKNAQVTCPQAATCTVRPHVPRVQDIVLRALSQTSLADVASSLTKRS